MFISSVSCAQRGQLEYAVGLRLGPATGLSVQYFRTSEKVVEGILYTRYRGFSLAGLYELHHKAFDVRGLRWFGGFGAHISSYRWFSGHPIWEDSFPGARLMCGVDGIIGLEYFLPDIPVQIAVDWKPEYQLIGWSGWMMDSGAISVRWRL